MVVINLEDKKCRVNISVPEKLRDTYKSKAKEIGLTSSALMLIALTEYLNSK